MTKQETLKEIDSILTSLQDMFHIGHPKIFFPTRDPQPHLEDVRELHRRSLCVPVIYEFNEIAAHLLATYLIFWGNKKDQRYLLFGLICYSLLGTCKELRYIGWLGQNYPGLPNFEASAKKVGISDRVLRYSHRSRQH